MNAQTAAAATEEAFAELTKLIPPYEVEHLRSTYEGDGPAAAALLAEDKADATVIMSRMRALQHLAAKLEEEAEAQAIQAANEGARRAFCPKCERGHEGECTGPLPAPRDTIPPKRAAIRRADAMRIIDHGGTVYAVAEANTFRLFDNAGIAREYADKLGVTHVLDWETGEYADA